MEVNGLQLDPLDRKLVEALPGRVVRKDLVHQTKSGYNVPVYVLEYLLGQYCSSTDPEVVEKGLDYVRQTLSRNYVRADESEKIKALTRQKGKHRIIDKVKVRLDTQADRFWAELVNMGVRDAVIDDAVVHQYDKLLMGGIWALVDLVYDPEFKVAGATRPFIIDRLKPIQQPTTELRDYITARAAFRRDEWLDILLRTIGIEATHADFSFRQKLLFLIRMVPMVESNYNLLELGPRGTGKSYLFREISPFAILVSGGQTTVPQLFIHLGTGKMGLVGLWNVVAFDEVAGVRFKDAMGIQILKDYMESGSFSRGKEEVPAEASIVFNGNIDGDIQRLVKTSHLLQPLSDQMQDLALIDRIHYYLPGWEMEKMRPEYLTQHYGLVVDYATEIWRGLRKTSYADVIDQHFSLGSHLNQRDVRAVRKTVSGLVKLLHPAGDFTKSEIQEYLEIGMEGRRRVKEQLRRMGGLEFWAVNFSYIDQDSRQETFVAVPEQGRGGLITPGVSEPGITFTVGSDQADGRLAIFRVEVQVAKGNGKLRITGTPSRGMRSALKTTHTYLSTHAARLGIGKDPADYDLHVQVVNLMGAKEGSEVGIAAFVAMVSALLGKPVLEALAVLGEMSLRGGLQSVGNLTERLQLAMDNGAKRILLPTESKRALFDAPEDVLNKLQIIFFSDPINATFRAMGLE
jgi:ATP-dependent Lon protease